MIRRSQYRAYAAGPCRREALASFDVARRSAVESLWQQPGERDDRNKPLSRTLRV
jgi:hypothetical protein